MERLVAIIPCYESAKTVGLVISELLRLRPRLPVVVVDDGSSDNSGEVARTAGAIVERHASNRGKGEALKTGLKIAHELGAELALTLDADGQHPAEEALRLAEEPASEKALVLGVRDLSRDGAPRLNRFSNAFSNLFVSAFSGRKLTDTQCGLRRYPVRQTLKLGARDRGYGYEAEVILRAAKLGWPIVQVPVRVLYPPPELRMTHFHAVRDPAKIVFRVLHTVFTAPRAT